MAVPELRNAEFYFRDYVTLYAVNAAAGATGVETAITLTRAFNTGATTTGVSFTPTKGKRFRIVGGLALAKGNATATKQVTVFSFRVNTAGAVVTTSTPILFQMQAATPATADAVDRVPLVIPSA